ncbi:MAG: aminotransferase class V-fold PLP-dependent enzyme [Acidobacteria bacterium]|nr:aminotransferase class V-fold PLP-dependent enzyme [Acidobacteriota bacterium]
MIYLDHNATTPLDPRVLDAMMPFLTDRFGNAASRHHRLGCDAATATETAREQVASTIGADPREIVWTSGATESDNLALQGVFGSPVYKKRHLITVATEHRAVLDTCEVLQSQGGEVTFLPVDTDGRLDLDRLVSAMTDETLLVSVMHANNETGVVHPIAEIGQRCRARGVLFHTDATQSFAKEPIDVNAMHIDLLSASAHKIHGPKGVGLLYVRRRDPRVRCQALLHGGGHERGLRSGTLNVPGIVGMGHAATLPFDTGIEALRDRLEQGLLTTLNGVQVNGGRARRLTTTTNLSFDGVDGATLMKRMPDLAVSSSSACTSALLQPSYVLGAMGCNEDRTRGSVRFSLGRFNTVDEIDAAIAMVADAVTTLRAVERGDDQGGVTRS